MLRWTRRGRSVRGPRRQRRRPRRRLRRSPRRVRCRVRDLSKHTQTQFQASVKSPSSIAARPEIELHHGDIHALPMDDAAADALACMQVLLLVTDVAPALLEFHRVLAPTGRLVIVETDWRSAVLNTSDKDLTHRLFEFWDTVAASPNLPARLGPLLRDAGFDVTAIEAVPILNTAFTPDSFSRDYVKGLARQAVAAGVLSDTEASHWIADLEQKERDGGYFFCVNRFVFTAVKT